VSIPDIVGELFSVRSRPGIWQKRSVRKNEKQGEKPAVQLLAGELPVGAGEMSEAEAFSFPWSGPAVCHRCVQLVRLCPPSRLIWRSVSATQAFLDGSQPGRVLSACFAWAQHHNVCCRRGTVCMKWGTHTKIRLCCWAIGITTDGRAISQDQGHAHSTSASRLFRGDARFCRSAVARQLSRLEKAYQRRRKGHSF
jgi:hypothetical protein